MPRYIYTAKSSPTQALQGNIEAESEEDAINKLTKMGYFPIMVEPEVVTLDKKHLFSFRKISNKDLVLFTRQLSSLVESGVNIINGLAIVSTQTSNKFLKSVLDDLTSRIKDGKSLSDSLAMHPYLFSSLYSAMIRTGEASGSLNITLGRLADFLERDEEFKNSLRASLAYPLFVTAVGVLTIFVLMVFVIPRLVSMFEDMGQILPLPTRILINTSGFIRSYWWLILATLSIFVFLIRRFYRSTQGKLSLDKFKLKVSFFSSLIVKTEISRLARTLALLLSSGTPITPSLDIASCVVDNQIYKTEVQKFKEEIASGSSLSGSLKNSKLFPQFVTNIIAIGEETGSLDKSLNRIADDYERDIERTLKTITRMFEPIIILVMGLIVGFIVLSMLLPIFQMNLIVR